MGLAYPTAGVRLVRLLDVVAVMWVALWILLALLVGREVRDLRELSDTVVTAGVAVEQTGGLLKTVGNVPFLGAQVSGVAEQVEEAGRSAQASGRDSRDSTENLSVLLALCIGLIPTLPLLGLYLPLRWAWTHEARAVRRALGNRPGDPLLEEFLAHRAVSNFSYDRLLAVSEQPYKDLEEGRYEALAGLELSRLGIRPAVSPLGGTGTSSA
jgi:hypothetical protein